MDLDKLDIGENWKRSADNLWDDVIIMERRSEIVGI